MKLIESSVQIIEEKDPYKMIELAGRTCYKSEDKITENSAKEFVDRMIKLGHGAMLEHGTIYLTIDGEDPNLSKIQSNPHTKVNLVPYEVLTESNYTISYKAYITTNLRVLVENNLKELLQYQVEPTEHHEKRITVKWILDRVTGNYTYWDGDWCDIDKMKIQLPSDNSITDNFLWCLNNAETQYNLLINKGWKPQQARQVLPFAVCSPLVMTGFESDWEHFFSLRCSSKAHPDAKKLADELYKLIHK